MPARLYSQTSQRKQRSTDHRSAKEAPTYKATNGFEQSGMTPLDALKLLRKQTCELKEYFSYFVAAKTDSVKLRLRNTALWALLSTLGLVSLSGLLIIAGWFLLNGMAGGFTVLFGDRLWLGDLATGFLSFIGLGLGMYYAVAKRMSISRKRVIQKYEERQTRQQTEFGRSVCDQAANAASANE